MDLEDPKCHFGCFGPDYEDPREPLEVLEKEVTGSNTVS